MNYVLKSNSTTHMKSQTDMIYYVAHASSQVFRVRFLTYFLFVFRLVVTLVISRFDFECEIWVLIAPVSGHCILVSINWYRAKAV